MTDFNKAIVLVSGGLDSTTTLAIAKDLGFDCYALTFAYGQRHLAELDAARQIARRFAAIQHKIIQIDLAGIGGSALTDSRIEVPVAPTDTDAIPVTYVPARNTLFLSHALAWAEVLDVNDIFIGVNAVDYSGYPDCRPEYISAFERLAALATKAGVEGAAFRIHTPLIELSKAGIIKQGQRLGVDYSITVSCYQADSAGRACGLCDACRFRKEGFAAASLADPTCYF